MNRKNYQIVTNNPVVKESYDKVIFVEGSFQDVLLKTRDLVHSGHRLINHPLGASIRMFFSPYRSILVTDKADKLDINHVEIIENSIVSYKKQMEHRKPDEANSKDYALIDSELLKSALEEHKRLSM
ncbi:MAG: hypothetical protein GX021_02405 [Tissierellia bacterium]|nr:hypothetical protein [Tissierellia bacterium]